MPPRRPPTARLDHARGAGARAARRSATCCTRIPAFAALTPDEQRELAARHGQGAGLHRRSQRRRRRDALARRRRRRRRAGAGAGRRRRADAAESRRKSRASPARTSRPARCARASSSSARWCKKVDFPKFVGGLIKNVFQAIVERSIEQMRAYGELIANVAKTVERVHERQHRRGGRAATGWPSAIPTRSVDVDRRGFADGDGEHRAAAARARRGPEARARRDQPRPRHDRQPVTDIDDAERRAAARHRGAAADGEVAPAAAGLDGHARHQPHRRHRRLDQRQGDVRHARRATRPSASYTRAR